MSSASPARIITIDPTAIDPARVDDAATMLRDGELVAIPTETVYGLGCNALDPEAIASVFAAKGRPATDPLIVHVDGLAMAATVVAGQLPAVATDLAAAFWPGPLTIVLPKHDSIPDAITSGGPTVGVRCPAHPVAAAIITAAGVPIAAPSANRFGRISPTSAAHVEEELGDRITAIVDAGRAEHGLESTVVTIDEHGVVVLRDGAITREALATVAAVRGVEDDEETRASAPGHDVRHYSPRTPTIATTVAPTDAPAGDVIYSGFADASVEVPTDWRCEPLGRRDDLAAVGHGLYDTLRRLDAMAPALIVVQLTEAPGLGRAIDDRLTRAASGMVADTADALHTAVETALR